MIYLSSVFFRVKLFFRSAIKLAQHRGSVHKLTLVDNNQVVLSAGEDAQVLGQTD